MRKLLSRAELMAAEIAAEQHGGDEIARALACLLTARVSMGDREPKPENVPEEVSRAILAALDIDDSHLPAIEPVVDLYLTLAVVTTLEGCDEEAIPEEER